jgi:hypothetical protein
LGRAFITLGVKAVVHRGLSLEMASGPRAPLQVASGPRAPRAVSPSSLSFLGWLAARPEDIERGAREGFANACAALGDLRMQSGARSEEVIALWRRAAARGQPHAELALGNAHTSGTEGVPRNVAEAARLYASAIKHFEARLDELREAGGAAHHMEPGELELEVTNARGNLASAHCSLGAALLGGGDGLPRSAEKAVQHMRRGAELGDTDALYNLAILTGRGEGVAEDAAKADEMLREAAAKGHEAARKLLGPDATGGRGGSAAAQRTQPPASASTSASVLASASTSAQPSAPMPSAATEVAAAASAAAASAASASSSASAAGAERRPPRLLAETERNRQHKCCAVCSAAAASFCTRCRVTPYCTRECQRAHWPRHKACLLYTSPSPRD